MNRESLSSEQRQHLGREIEVRRHWIHKLHIRMRAQQWDEACPVYRATIETLEAISKLQLAVRFEREERAAPWTSHLGG